MFVKMVDRVYSFYDEFPEKELGCFFGASNTFSIAHDNIGLYTEFFVTEELPTDVNPMPHYYNS